MSLAFSVNVSLVAILLGLVVWYWWRKQPRPGQEFAPAASDTAIWTSPQYLRFNQPVR